ncbi:membrane protein [Microbacterium phage Fizzles]|nr:membrane protein [Microbacterium phage Fizzles]
MKKIIASAAIAAFATLGVACVAAPASATTSVDSFGVCVPSGDTTTVVVHPAVGTPTLTVPNPEYVPAVPGTPGVPAIGEPTIEVENPAYIPAVPTIPAQPAIGEPTKVIDNPDYIAPTYTPGFWQDVPAVGTPTIIVQQPNPDYVPAVAEIPEVSHTDYVAKRYVIDVHSQPAVTKTQWRYVKHGGYGEVWVDNDSSKYVDSNGNPVDFWSWDKYERTQKTRVVEVTPAVQEQGHWEEGTFHEYPGDGWTILSESKHVTQEYVPGTPAQGSETIDVEVTNPDYVPATQVWVPPVYTPAVGEKTITVPNPDYVPATEEIPGTPAVGEPTIVIENPAYIPAVPGTDEIPAVGEPTKEIPNPAYVAEWAEIVIVDGVECPPVVPEEPTAPEEEPVVAPVTAPTLRSVAAKAAPAESVDTLAQTGGEANLALLLGAGGLVVAGGALAAARRRRHS